MWRFLPILLLPVLAACGPAAVGAPPPVSPGPVLGPGHGTPGTSPDLGQVPEGACKQAAEAARDAVLRGAIYSQGGALAGDPIDPATGQFLPNHGPNSFDCAGLTWWAYAQSGVDIGRGASAQMYVGQRTGCTLAQLNGKATTCWAPGDLAFVGGPCGTPACHVSIYVGAGVFADCLNHDRPGDPYSGCILWRPQGTFYEGGFLWATRIDLVCAQGVTS